MEGSTTAKKSQITDFTCTFLQQVLETTAEQLPLPIRAHLSNILYPDIKIIKSQIPNKLCSVCGFDLLKGLVVVAQKKRKTPNKKFLSVKCLACSSSFPKVRFVPTRRKNSEKAEASKRSINSFCNSPNISIGSKNVLSFGRRRFKKVEKLQKLAEMDKQKGGSDSPLNNSLSNFLLSFTK
ncbi:hypothetical protein niasHS_014761 [Heterodera schachtii]|uniref:Uncharacterized protein n=1 Tax=Heterodera schachtii TaxID=97005 RepID=A0ABD2IFJ5_HETSC